MASHVSCGRHCGAKRLETCLLVGQSEVARERRHTWFARTPPLSEMAQQLPSRLLPVLPPCFRGEKQHVDRDHWDVLIVFVCRGSECNELLTFLARLARPQMLLREKTSTSPFNSQMSSEWNIPGFYKLAADPIPQHGCVHFHS